MHAFKAFRLETIAYVIKPLSISNITNAIDKFFSFKSMFTQKLEDQSSKDRFAVRQGNKMHYLATNDVAFFFAEDKTVYFYAKNGGRYVVDYTLDTLETQLNNKLFFRINRQIVAKIDAIQSIQKHEDRRLQLSLAHGKTFYDFVVSRTKVKAVKKWIGV